MKDPEQVLDLEERNRELVILNEIAAALNESIDLSESLEVALAHVADLFGLRTGWVWLLRDDDGEPYLAAARNLPPGLADRPGAMEGGCYCLDTFRAGDLSGAANVNVVKCSRLRWLTEGTDGLAYHSSIPLYVRGAHLGVLNVASPEWRRLSPDDLRLLHTIGEMVATAVERARLFRRSSEAGAIEERNRLAREIHDTLAQGLAATALQLDAADALLAGEGKPEPERVRRAIQAALEGTRRNLDEVRRSVLDLRAAPLEGRTLAEALGELAKLRNRDHALPRQDEDQAFHAPEVRFEAVGGAHPLPARIEAAFYRVAQEALTNALEHAEATRVRISLVTHPERVELEVEDDGRGFEGAPSAEGRFGLVGMRERMRLVDGRLRVQSQPGEGTRIEASAPLHIR